MGLLRWPVNRVQGAFNSWVEGLIIAAGVIVGLAVWRALKSHLSGSLSLPTWAVAAAIGLVLAILVVQALRLRERGGHVEGITNVALYSEQMRAITTAYAEHLNEILYAFQRVVGGEVPGVTVKDWIEDGILEPARDIIRSRQTGDVRLSILEPDGTDFVMAFGAGHTLESKRNFRLAIEDSYSRWAFRNNRIMWSGDLSSDPEYTRHPKATPERDYNSIICVPIRRGGVVVGVFNTIFTPTEAFDEADLLYVRLIGAVIELVWSLYGPTADEENAGAES